MLMNQLVCLRYSCCHKTFCWCWKKEEHFNTCKDGESCLCSGLQTVGLLSHSWITLSELFLTPTGALWWLSTGKCLKDCCVAKPSDHKKQSLSRSLTCVIKGCTTIHLEWFTLCYISKCNNAVRFRILSEDVQRNLHFSVSTFDTYDCVPIRGRAECSRD